MKIQFFIPMTALALLLAACVAPLPAPPPRVQLPVSERTQLPLDQKTDASKVQIELPMAISTTQPTEAVLRYQAQRQLYDAGYRPPNALLDVKVDRYTAMKQLYDAGYRPPNALLDVTR